MKFSKMSPSEKGLYKSIAVLILSIIFAVINIVCLVYSIIGVVNKIGCID